MSGTRASNDRPPSAGGVKRGRLQHEAATTGSRVTVVLGAQWGDEGKGKVVDLLATDADVVSRCQVRAGRRAPPPPRSRRTLPSLPSRPPQHAPWTPSLRGHPPQPPPPPTRGRPSSLPHGLPQGPRLPRRPHPQARGPGAEL